MTAAEGGKNFFVSYTGADGRWAEWIAWVLEEAGHTVVLQAWDFRPGSNFVLAMQQAAEEPTLSQGAVEVGGVRVGDPKLGSVLSGLWASLERRGR